MHGEIECYLVKNKNGYYWGFPKGHAENHESPKEAAERELKEETGLSIVQFLADEPILEKYVFGHQGKLVDKTVFYFLAEVSKVAVIQLDEIIEGKWVLWKDAEWILTYEAGKEVYKQAQQLLDRLNEIF